MGATAGATSKLNITPLTWCSAMWQRAIYRPGFVTSSRIDPEPADRGDLCTLFERGGMSCGRPLSKSQPIPFCTLNRSPTTGATFVASGLALDGVTAVSFTVSGKAVEVPVENNV